ncbi:uncharacterized protein A1O5_12801 [Cladophialophora psammophila CBS 110553]|uniref:Uncharacterized protein n=1 Tax=Cladophialophora psammophila CBS 110553 TaxID=1182543 RepID=W9VHD6_9EURO|nr:uncharacterized protein A1O5_12801 [Cladophialophora psammophila CBS 110553]EXJ55062.1 hypothetical protein A1O5_12801 [Cladophialophora psammophila CBS 110553]
MAYTNGVVNGVSQPDHTAIVIRAGISDVRILYELRKRGIDGKKVDFTDKRVDIFGTGATSVQIIPIVAHSARKLTMFQRTPNYVLPGRNFLFIEDQVREIKNDFQGIAERAQAQPFGADIPVVNRSSLDVKDDEKLQQILDCGWERGGLRYVFETLDDMMTNAECNKKASQFRRRKIPSIVQDPATAETLFPYYPLMCKRPLLGHFYYETFNTSNVELVDLKKDLVQEITLTGARTSSKEFELFFAIGKFEMLQFFPFSSFIPFATLTSHDTGTPISMGQSPNYSRSHRRLDRKNDAADRIETKEVARAWTEKVDRAFSSTLMEEGAKET